MSSAWLGSLGRACLLALPLWLAAGPAQAQGKAGGFADTTLRRSVEAQGERFIAAVLERTPEARLRIAAEVFAPSIAEDRRSALLSRLADTYGALEYHHSEAFARGEGASRRVVMHVYARSPEQSRWHDFQFMLEPSAPHRLAQLLFIADVAEPIYLPNGDITDPQTLDWLNDYIARLVSEEGLAGGILIAQGDRVLIRRAFGYADSARHRPMHVGNRFTLASGGKMFTALAIAQLVNAGRVQWDAPLSRYRPELSRQPSIGNVTIAQLMSHTSGIAEYWNATFEQSRARVRTLEDFVPHIVAAGASGRPGESYEYSNSNFILLGLVIEAVTKKPYAEFVQQALWSPVGMTHTAMDASDTSLVEPLVRDGTRWRRSTRTSLRAHGSPAGGAVSTLDDMLRFGRALVRGAIVPDSTLRRMTARQTPDSGDGEYGFGFLLEGRTPEARSFGHGGITEGVNFEFRYFPAFDVTLIAFSNQDNGAYDDLRRNAIRLVTGER